jgi:kynurenine formamidase
MAKIYDISVTITNKIPVWPGDPKVKLERVSKCDLSKVEPGMYVLYALPTKLGGSDGAPVRAALISD